MHVVVLGRERTRSTNQVGLAVSFSRSGIVPDWLLAEHKEAKRNTMVALSHLLDLAAKKIASSWRLGWLAQDCLEGKRTS
jgi:hypothetical protein